MLPSIILTVVKMAITKVIPISELSSELERLVIQLQMNSVEDLYDRVRDNVPVDTGALKESIKIESGNVVSTSEYAEYVEYGTEKMQAQPFFQTSADSWETIVQGNLDE